MYDLLNPPSGPSPSKAGICEMFEGHQGPVTGLSCHGAVGTIDFSHLFLTSSFDWTVKLWSTKVSQRTGECVCWGGGGVGSG